MTTTQELESYRTQVQAYSPETLAAVAQSLMGDPANTLLIGVLTTRYLELTA